MGRHGSVSPHLIAVQAAVDPPRETLGRHVVAGSNIHGMPVRNGIPAETDRERAPRPSQRPLVRKCGTVCRRLEGRRASPPVTWRRCGT